jgi:HPt (histidine-containing phosphotransfer) domain-containing protein|tara:strand:+ start:464 stop:775 length:312 start_codon:yes stop_codon:yes gene_type:complete
MVHLGTYTQGDRTLEGELLSMFLPSAQGYMDAMTAGAEGRDEGWWTAAHSLKGVALGVGAWEIAALAEAAEGHRDSPPPVRQGDVAALQAALERVRCFVANLT